MVWHDDRAARLQTARFRDRPLDDEIDEVVAQHFEGGQVHERHEGREPLAIRHVELTLGACGHSEDQLDQVQALQ